MNTLEIVERVREAGDAGTALRVKGAGTWLNAGRPAGTSGSLDLANDTGIVEYVPGDLTLTARAGTRLSELHAATLAHGQWLTLDPWGGGDGSLGATISTATTGPHSFAMGLPRDVVLGLEFVTGNGDVVRSGGRVVKNVAGYDLTRLVTGSWGTLGVITEATVRLRARPDLTRSVAIAVDARRDATAALAVRLRTLPFAPLASELVNGTLARMLGLPDETALLLQLGGNERSVGAQLDLLTAMGSVREVADSVWYALRTADAGAVASWRWSRRPTDFAEHVWSVATKVAQQSEGLLVHANPARGVARLIAIAGASPQTLARMASSFTGTTAIEVLPRDAWPHVPTPQVANALPAAIREKFDRHHVLNPGVMEALA